MALPLVRRAADVILRYLPSILLAALLLIAFVLAWAGDNRDRRWARRARLERAARVDPDAEMVDAVERAYERLREPSAD
jgi:hypothetical protein